MLSVTHLRGSFSPTFTPTLNISAPSAIWPLADATTPVSLVTAPAQLPPQWGSSLPVHDFQGASARLGGVRGSRSHSGE